MSTSKPSSLRSSFDDGSTPGQLRSQSLSIPTQASSLGTPQATPSSIPRRQFASLHAVPSGSLRTASTLAKSNSGISGPSPSFIAAHGEFHSSNNASAGNGNPGCVGQLDTGDGPRGLKNPYGLSLDKSIGYFPQDSNAVPGSIPQSDVTGLSDRPSLDDLLRMIAADRLHHMPQKGSNWDRSTRTLESFALQVSGYASRYTSIVGNAELTATMIYGRCYALLQLGRSQAMSLVPALGILASVSHTLSLFTSCLQQPTRSQLQQSLGQTLDRTLDLLNGIISYFQDLSIGLGTSGLRDSVSRSLEAFDLQAEQLLNEIWTYHIPSEFQELTVQFKQIRQLLQSQDEVTRTAQRVLLAERDLRHEFTCEWFSKQFLDFVQGSDSSFWVDGGIGCGKSVLCGWVLESLQSPVGGQKYAVISYAINPLLPSETSTICVIKALLRQLLEQQYGSRNMCQALANLMDTITAGDAPTQVEEVLWGCFQVAVDDAVQPTFLVIDGLSELEGGEQAAAAVFQTLLDVISRNRVIRLLVLSRPFAFSPGTHLRRKTVEARDIQKDIRRVITELVSSSSSTSSTEVARKIDHEASGNFLWSLLTLQYWGTNDFSSQTWKTLPASLDATVTLLVSNIDLSDQLNCQILFSSIIAARPLRLAELEFFSRLDVKNEMLMPQGPDITRAIKQGCGSLLVIQDGIVLFRHALLRQALLDTLQFETLSLSPEMHAGIANRLLLYIKISLRQHSDLTLKLLPSLEDLFHGHPLLHYALRYWTSHFVASAMYDGSSFSPNAECKHVFPETVNAAIVEASFWTRHLSCESLQALKISAAARKEILGNSEATLQTIACLADALRCTKDYVGAANHFYMASEIAQEVLPNFHPFTATCMSRFLDVIDLADESLISDLPSRKATLLRYMISMHGAQYGPSSDQVLAYGLSLANHYATMQEHILSTEMYQNIHRLNVDRHGRDSSQAKAIAEKLATAYQCQSEEGESLYSDSVYDDILQTYEVTDPRRIKASIAKAEAYKSDDDQFNAELLYISLWHGIAEACQRQKTLENHERLLEIGLAYSKFLCDYGRLSDAQTVLLGLWSQQQAQGFKSDLTNALLAGIATAMKHCGLQDMALDVLNSVLVGSEAQDPVRQSILEISLDLVHDAQSSFPPGEATLLRILNLFPTDVSVVNALVSLLIAGDRFGEVISLATETLHRLRPSILNEIRGQESNEGPIDPETAKLATNLAEAYTRIDQMEMVGTIYWHLFQAARHSNTIDDSTVTGYAHTALQAFKQSGKTFRMISLREALLDYCIERHGEDQSVEARYALASLYAQERLFENAKDQYVRISDTLKRPSFHDIAALPALRRLIDIYSKENSWDKAQEAYGKLWNTFLTKGVEFGFDASNSKELYEGYIASIRKRDPVDIGALHEITGQYRAACGTMYGERHPSTMEAVLLLAESWGLRHPDGTEAIKLYEWLVDGEDVTLPDHRDDARANTPLRREDSRATTPNIRAIVEAAESRLTDFYAVNSDSMRGNTITRAVRLQGKRYHKDKGHWGASHPTTLSSLTIFVLMLKKLDFRKAIRELELAIDSVIGSDVQPSSLYHAAVVLATSFAANGFVEEGLKTVQRLTEQVIFEQSDSDQPARRSNLVFLTAFEAHLTGSMVDFAGTHARVLMELVLWEYYQRLRQTDTDPGLIFAAGAKLRNFLVEHSASDRAALIEKDMFDRFLGDYGAAFAQSTQTVRDFFLILLQEFTSEKLQIDIPDYAAAALAKNVGNLLEEGQYQSVVDLAIPGFEFIQFVGAFANPNNSNLEIGLRMGLMLAREDVTPVPLGTKMPDLSKTILQETLRSCRQSQNFNINTLNIDLISDVALTLDLQQNYEDLEASNLYDDCVFRRLEVLIGLEQWLLSKLWMSRKHLTSLSQDVIVSIGRRLAEVRFFHGHLDSAIALGEDILYNVQRVYGTKHPSTVDIANLLSTMYVAVGDHAAAKAINGDVSPLRMSDTKGYKAKANPASAVDNSKSNSEHLLQFYQRTSGTDVGPAAKQPVNWGFIDRGGEKGLAYKEQSTSCGG